jgi:DDE superfamily endonuclease
MGAHEMSGGRNIQQSGGSMPLFTVTMKPNGSTNAESRHLALIESVAQCRAALKSRILSRRSLCCTQIMDNDGLTALKSRTNGLSQRLQLQAGWPLLSAHKTALVRQFLEHNPRVRFHYTPTYSSWLNQVELWFAKIQRDVIARGVFTSVPDLARKLRRYINAYSANAQPIQWKYSDPSRRIRSNEISAVTLHSNPGICPDWLFCCT